MSVLPLFVRAPEDDGTFVHVTPRARAIRDDADAPFADGPSCGVARTDRMPDRAPGAGEQYRFHVDMDACIGCKCCVVACNEQNGNPASINWRRVAEIEGGRFPKARRAYFSMGCNHCLDPTCLAGCPVDAYTKDNATGIVRHSAETCIGCQYCTWTCSYGVPQFNPERRVVGKCDMCYGRLAEGQAPACVSACPEGAIAIEVVNVAEWRRQLAEAEPGQGLALRDGSLSTTRVTVPAGLPVNARPLDLEKVAPGDPHAPLIVMTVLTQLAVGAFVALVLVAIVGSVAGLLMPSAVALSVAGLGLAAATAHLGRPIHAYRAMRMWRRSWLSREVVLFGAFAKLAAATTAALFFDWPYASALGVVTVAVGLAGVGASARIYHVVSRPAWNSLRTEFEFFGSSVLLGALFALTAGVGVADVWRVVAVSAAVVLGLGFFGVCHHWAAAPLVELRGSAKLLGGKLRRHVLLRIACLAVGGVLLPLLANGPMTAGLALLIATAGEGVGRYLFFVSAVPKHLTTPYTSLGSEAA